MKKFVIVLSLAALALTTTAYAKDGNKNHEHRGLHLGILKHNANKFDRGLSDSQFVLTGTVVSSTSTSLTVNVRGSAHVSNIVNGQSTVIVNSATVVIEEKNQTITLANLTAGSQVVVSGDVSDSTLTAKKIHMIFPKGKAYGEVTAKTDTSVTIKNNLTGATQTFTTDGDTKVAINGEVKTTTDVQLGDKGFVKFKTTISGAIAKMIKLFR